MSQRIKGQETQIVMTGPEGLEEGVIDVQTFEAELQLEILTEGYLGEKTNRKDDIFNGVRGRAELHMESTAFFRFLEGVKERAQRRDEDSANERYSISTSFSFANGERARALFEDVKFGAAPIRIGGRGEYVQATLEWECEDGRWLY